MDTKAASKNRHSSTTTFLPTDLIVSEILTRLPCKSLLRFKCVSKEWYQLLHLSTSKTFIYSHLKRSQENDNTPLVLLQLNCIRKTNTQFLLCYPEFHPFMKHRLTSPYSYHKFFETPPPRFQNSHPCFLYIIGFSNGLICIYDFHNSHNLVLYNPINRNYRKLPTSSDGSNQGGIKKASVGFYYDPLLDDYKVVKVFFIPNTDDPVTCKLYSMRTNSWETKTMNSHNIKPGSVPLHYAGEFLNDNVHWILDADGIRSILTFHVHTQSFGYLPLPSCSFHFRPVMLRSLGGYLFFVMLEATEISVWILQEYGKAESWKRLVSTKVLPRPNMPLLVAYFPGRVGGDVLLLRQYDKFFEYNISNQSIVQIDLPIPFGRCALLMVGSLVPIPGCDDMNTMGQESLSQL